MLVHEALAARQSVRKFLDRMPEHGDIVKILEYAKRSPSGTNTQPWQVAVVSGATKAALDQN